MGHIRIRIAALIRQGDSVLLIEHRKGDRKYWLLPGGGLEYGEGIKACLEREMREETNLQVSVGDLAFVSESIDPQGKRHVVHMVYWSEIKGGELHVGEEERLNSVAFVPISQLGSLTLHPPIEDHLERLLRNEKALPIHLGQLWRD